MKQDSVEVKFNALETKVLKLIAEFKKLKEEKAALDLENKRLKQQLEVKDQEFKNFQNQEKITKIVSSFADGTRDITQLKLKINEYIREIDKCIAHLSE